MFANGRSLGAAVARAFAWRELADQEIRTANTTRERRTDKRHHDRAHRMVTCEIEQIQSKREWNDLMKILEKNDLKII